MQFDFNKPVFDLDDKPVKDEAGADITVGQVMARELSRANEGNARKMYDWAKQMQKGQPVYLDREDKKKLIEFFEGLKTISNLSKSQILDILETTTGE